MLVPYKIRIDVPGEPDLIELNGEDRTAEVGGITVQRRVGEPARVFVEAIEGGTFEGVGYVSVVPDHPDGAVIAAWLRAQSPGDVEAAVLNGSDLASSPGTGFIEELARRAEASNASN